MHVSITSYGVRHGAAPQPGTPTPIHVDLTTALRNPAADPAMIDMTGLDHRVRQHVLHTPGAHQIIENTLQQIDTAPPASRVEVFTFCQGGRHRSVAIAEELAAALRSRGVHCQVIHRDVQKPVLR